MTGPPQPLPWDPTPVPGWVEQVNAWPWSAESHPLSTAVLGHAKSGPCPRCGHPMKVRKPGPGYFGLAPEKAEAPQPPASVLARCNCSGTHPDRPDGATTGCGQAGFADGPGSAEPPA